MTHFVEDDQRVKDTRAVFEKHAGNIRATAKELGVSRSTVRRRLELTGKDKPLAGGTVVGVQAEKRDLPAPGEIKRYIPTSAPFLLFITTSGSLKVT